MPCHSYGPTENERELMKVCQLLMYVQTKQKKMILPNWVRDNAELRYADMANLDKATRMLCLVCKEMSQHDQARIIYNGREAEARRLADWWDTHQALDLKREQEEKANRERLKVQKQALKKLSRSERHALGYK